MEQTVVSNSVSSAIKSGIIENIDNAFAQYGVAIALIVVGFVIGTAYKTYIGDRKFNKSNRALIQSKDDRINDLNTALHARLSKVSVGQIDKKFFVRLKKMFLKKVK